jgi:hypothetical protein
MVGYAPVPADCMGHGWARTRNLSRTGVRLLASRPFKPQNPLTLRLYSTTSLAFRVIPARVAYAYRDNVGNWVVGCKFDKPLSQAELDALL